MTKATATIWTEHASQAMFLSEQAEDIGIEFAAEGKYLETEDGAFFEFECWADEPQFFWSASHIELIDFLIHD